jgi:hypothetical protein
VTHSVQLAVAVVHGAAEAVAAVTVIPTSAAMAM